MVEAGYLFPGQGAQYVGMGKDFYEHFPAAREVFNQADEILKINLSRACFEGPISELTRTEISQPAILTTSVAVLRVFQSINRDYTPVITAGLSLGEYTALVLAGAMDFPAALRLVRKRGEFMEDASRINAGKMACILGLPLKETEEICRQTGTQVANLNCPGQVVISGDVKKVDAASGLAMSKGAKKVIALEVSGAFHSGLMKPAGEKLSRVLKETEIIPPSIPVISNVTAEPVKAPDEIRMRLAEQVSSPVRWEACVRLMAAKGVKNFIEFCPGKVLKGLLKRIDAGLNVIGLDKVEDLKMMEGESDAVKR